jgi:capsular exopolysaccharide synthesis family protein
MLRKHQQKTVMVAGPHDDSGNTFMVSALGINTAHFSNLKTLLVDFNLRRPQLHIPFGLKIEKGFSEVASGIVEWKSVIKDTELAGLKIMTAGKLNSELFRFINRSLLEGLIEEVKNHFDLIIIDTSPLLIHNKNNVDPSLLSLVCDMVVIVIQDKKTTTYDLENAIDAIPEGNKKISGIIFNHQF